MNSLFDIEIEEIVIAELYLIRPDLQQQPYLHTWSSNKLFVFAIMWLPNIDLKIAYDGHIVNELLFSIYDPTCFDQLEREITSIFNAQIIDLNDVINYFLPDYAMYYDPIKFCWNINNTIVYNSTYAVVWDFMRKEHDFHRQILENCEQMLRKAIR